MKTISQLAGLLSLLWCLSSQAQSLQVVDGTCMLETTREVIYVRNVDPARRYGVFAVGSSREGDSVYLDENSTNAVTIWIRAEDNVSYSTVSLAPNGPTKITTGVSLKRKVGPTDEWLSCHLDVR